MVSQYLICVCVMCYFRLTDIQMKQIIALLWPIYKVRFLLVIVACDVYSASCSHHGKIVYNFYDIKLPVAMIVIGF